MPLERVASRQILASIMLEEFRSQERVEKAMNMLTETERMAAPLEERTVGESIVEFLETRIGNGETHLTYSSVMGRLKERYGALLLSELTTLKVKEFLERPKKDGGRLSPNTFNKEKAAISAFWNWLTVNGYHGRSPVAGVRHAKPMPGKPVALRPAEQVRLLELTRKSKRLGLRHFTMTVFFLYTGVRVSELIIVKWSDLAVDRKLINVLGKGGKPRAVPLLPPVADALSEYRKELALKGLVPTENDYIFVNSQGPKRGQPMCRDGIEKLYRNMFRELGKPPGVSVHCLRHTFAVNLVWLGVELAFIQHVLGHENIDTTMTYTRLADLDVVKALNERCKHLTLGTVDKSTATEWKRAFEDCLPVLSKDKEE